MYLLVSSVVIIVCLSIWPLKLTECSTRSDVEVEISCSNQHGDVGACMTASECRLLRGVSISDTSCPSGIANAHQDILNLGSPIKYICCYTLPCSRSTIRMDVMESVFKLGLHNAPDFSNVRSKRSVGQHVAVYEMLMAPIVRPRGAAMSRRAPPSCGLPYFGPNLQPKRTRKSRMFDETKVRQFARHVRQRFQSSSASIRKFRHPQIVSETNFPSQARFPWLMSLWTASTSGRRQLVPVCAATIIHKWFAVTAAHCIKRGQADSRPDLNGPLTEDEQTDSLVSGRKYLLLGGTNLNRLRSGTVIRVDWARTHPAFDSNTFENDIALLKFGMPLRFDNKISPMCLPAPLSKNDAELTDYTGETVFVAGWGCLDETCNTKLDAGPTAASGPKLPDPQRQRGTGVEWLKHTDMTIISSDLAMCWFMNDSSNAGTSEYIPSRVFVVAGDASGTRSTCRGDSGSSVIRFRPIVHQISPVSGHHVGAQGYDVVDPRVMRGHWEMIGIVSWSRGCGRPFRPSVWTRVETYVDWIKRAMNTK